MPYMCPQYKEVTSERNCENAVAPCCLRMQDARESATTYVQGTVNYKLYSFPKKKIALNILKFHYH
jgi:hypothetical protein